MSPLNIDRQELYEGGHSIVVLVVGKSGRGKSTALRNLPPEETFLVNVLSKPLPFLGGSKLYKEGKNMLISHNASEIRQMMRNVGGEESANYIVIDDILYVMAAEFMQKIQIKGFDKFSTMANNIYEIIKLAGELRPTLKVFINCHEEETPTERKSRWFGKLIEEKIVPEAMSTIVLFADVAISGDSEPIYYFQTQSDGICAAKSPMGMFPLTIPNDLMLVAQRIDEYYSGVPFAESELDFGSLEIKKQRREQ